MAEVLARSGVTFRPSAVASASVVQSSGMDVTFLTVSTTKAVRAHPATSTPQFNSDLPGISSGGYVGSLAFFDEPAGPVDWIIAPFLAGDPLCYNLPNDLKFLFDDLDERVEEGGGGGGDFNGSDAVFELHNATDGTKKIRFDLSTISPSTTRAYKLPNINGTLATLANIAQTFTGPVTFANTVSGLTKSTVGLSHVDDTSDADKPISDDTQAALALKANLSLIGVPNGITPLDSDNKVPAIFLPSYVDDVIEVDTYTDLPIPGERSKIYITTDTDFQYRWGGTVYIQMVSSPGTTDNVPEGTSNLYFTNSRAVAALSAALALKANLASPALTGVPTAPTATAGTNTTQLATTAFVAGALAAFVAPVTSVNGHVGAVTVTASDVGLGNVNNTSDEDKPVSTAQQTALDLKLDKVTTDYQVYATDNTGSQVTLGYSTGSTLISTVAQRTSAGQLLATTLADGDVGATDDDLINRAYAAQFRGDRMSHATLSNGGSRTIADDEDVLILLGSDVASYTVSLPSAQTRYRSVLVVFQAAVTALTIDPGLQVGGITPNTIDWIPTSAKANDAISYGYDWDHHNWVVLNAWMGEATGPATTDDLPEGTTNLYFTDTRAQSALTSALLLKADLASPALTGVPTAPTASQGTSTTQLATTAFVTVGLDLKADLSSPIFTGTPSGPTAAPGTNTTQFATTAFVTAGLALKANIASPTFTGVPAGPTASPGTNTTQFATTAFVTAAFSAYTAPVTSVNGHVGAVTVTKGDVGLGNADDTSDINKPVSTAQQAALDLKVNLSLIGVANGIVPLGADIKIPSTYLPSYVDDVIEVANYAALPATGEAGKIYITLDTNFEYRWGGSVYIQLRASPGTTDDVPEGTTNLYFTDARAISALSGSLALKANLASPALTGTPTAPTAAPGTNTTQLSTTAFVAAGLALKADLASPALTGVPTAPTATAGTNTTQLATTAFVGTAMGGYLPLIGGTLSGTLNVGNGTTTALLTVNGAAGSTREFQFLTNGSSRWRHRVTATAESGANAGSDYAFSSFDDTGTVIGTVYTVTRATRALTFTVSPFAPTPTAGTNDTTVATTAFVGTALGGYLPLIGGTLTGSLVIGTSTGPNVVLAISTAAGNQPSLRWVEAGIRTYQMGPNSSGNFTFNSYDGSTGTLIGTVFTVVGTGNVLTFTASPVAPTPTAGNSSTLVATTAFVGTALGGYLPLTGGTLNGTLSVGNGSTAASFVINGAASQARDLNFRTAGSTRWLHRANTTAESGSNAGSDYQFYAFDDAGASLGTVYSVTRSTRVMAFTVSPTAPTPTAGDNTTKVATTAFTATAISNALVDYAPIASPTFTGIVTLPANTYIDAAAATNRVLYYRTAGLSRWALYTNATAESGSNAGSDLVLQAYNDAGSSLGTVYTVTRSNRTLTFSTIPFAPTPTAGTNNTSIATTAFVTTAVAAADYLPTANPIFTGSLAGPSLIARGAAGSNRFVRWQTGSVDRFYLYCNSTAEGGSDTGSNLTLRALDDTGATVLDVFTVTRASGLLTFGTPPAVGTVSAGNNTTLAASTAFVTTAISGKANSASPTFTGTPLAPTATLGTNTTQIATTAFVQAALADTGTGVLRTTKTIAVSAVGTFALPGTSNYMFMLTIAGVSTCYAHGMVYNVNSSVRDVILFNTLLVDRSTSALTGTTGTSGRVTVSVANGTGSLYVENRTATNAFVLSCW